MNNGSCPTLEGPRQTQGTFKRQQLSEGAVTVLAVETLLKEGGKFGINRWWHLELTA